VALLGMLVPAYEGIKGRPNLERVLTLHTKLSDEGKTLSFEVISLLKEILILRQRDFVYCMTAYDKVADEKHGFFIRALMQLLNMYRPRSVSYEDFTSYFVDDTPVHCQSFVWQQGQRRDTWDSTCRWRRGSDSSDSSASSVASASSFWSNHSTASSNTSVASSTSYFASDKIAISRPGTSGGRLEGNGRRAYVAPARRGSNEDIMKMKSWR
jgi:hypothetical protein